MLKVKNMNPIRTWYAGRRFRSRLEARWAVWFDAMKVPWEYENLGFDVGNTRYLPDFEIPSWNMHIEIKPEHIKAKEQARLTAIVQAWGGESGLAIIRGVPYYGEYVLEMAPYLYVYRFATCRKCDGICYTDGEGGWGNLGKHTCGDHDRAPVEDDDRLLKAYTYAMGHEFEHFTAKHGPDAAAVRQKQEGGV